MTDAGSLTQAVDGHGATPDLARGDAFRHFGDYELQREIARGGMGVVYKARQVKLNRPVALKMILAGNLAGEAEIRRFYLEAEAAANLNHPGIVPIFEVGQHEGQHFFSMGFVEGQSLAHRVATGPLPPREAASVIVQIAEAVQYAHENDVIHRDLKPGNVLLDAQGHPKVTDFGLAKKLRSDSALTASGQIMGTPSYMSPEQAQARADVGPLADVYSLGAILFCLLTGRPPFQAANVMETLKQVVEQDPPAPRTLNAAIPLDLETIALKCLRKEPHRRYGSARELAEDLIRFLADKPILARQITTSERYRRWARRNPTIATLGGILTGVLVLVTIGSLLAAGRFAEIAERAQNATIAERAAGQEASLRAKAESLARQEADLARKVAEKAEAEAKDQRNLLRIERDHARQNLYYAEMTLAGIAAETPSGLSRVDELLARWGPTAPGADLRGWEWHYLDSLSRQPVLNLHGHVGQVKAVAFTQDGKRLATGGEDRVVRIWDAATGRQLTLLKGH